MSDVVTADEFHAEREKLEKDRAMLNERLQALNVDPVSYTHLRAHET